MKKQKRRFLLFPETSRKRRGRKEEFAAHRKKGVPRKKRCKGENRAASGMAACPLGFPESRKIVLSAQNNFCEIAFNNYCASKTTLLRPRTRFAVRLMKEGESAMRKRRRAVTGIAQREKTMSRAQSEHCCRP